MVEILGHNLARFFNGVNAECVYKGERYEVWNVPPVIFEDMCQLRESDFERLSGAGSWWEPCRESDIEHWIEHVHINGVELVGWKGGYKKEGYVFDSLSEYFKICCRVSATKDIAALATDMARINKMSLGELFTRCEPKI